MEGGRTQTGAGARAETEYVIEPGTHEMVLTRVLNAPLELVFKACTDPELVARWWGPRRLTSTIEALDVRPGGSWRIVQRDAIGNVYGFHGVFHDVVAPHRLVQTFEFEGAPGHVALQTSTFEETGGKTKLVRHSVFQSVADRDAMVSSGMRSGADESYERLEELLRDMA